MEGNLPLARPVAQIEEVEAAVRVLASRHWAQGPEVAALEGEVEAILGSNSRVVAVSSGGAALLLALRALGIGPSGKVLVPCFTFPAAAQAAAFLGAEPIPVDVDPETMAVSAETIMPELDAGANAIVVAHAFGIPADVEDVVAAANQRGIPVIEDAACSLGGLTAGGAPAGSVGAFGVFSLHPRKPVAAGEGGLIRCGEDFLARLRTLRDYGRTGKGFGDVFGAEGLNFRLGDLPAAIARVQLSRLSESRRRREILAARYVERLQGCAAVRIPGGYLRQGQTWQSFVIAVPAPASRLVERLHSLGIEAGPAGHALTEQPFFLRRWGRSRWCPVSEELGRRCVALPLFDEMETSDVDRVVDAMTRVV